MRGKRARRVETDDRHVGRLVVRRVLAGRLAERRGIGGDVENVVHHLERQADGRRIGVERAHRVAGRRLARERAHAHRRAQQRARLHPMHRLQRVARERHADAREIDRLAARHADRAARERELAHERRLPVGRQRGGVGQRDESLRLQRVADEQRGRLVVLDVDGRLAATQRVVIHARHIIMHERIHVNHLERSRRRVTRRLRRARKLARRMAQQRTHAFAAPEHRIAHRFVQLRGRHSLGR
ncbi:hypothetical protein Y025_5570 [Burkholderia pseudomallei TSV32]|nr:hypothetical protein Y025_5570 [Burkholderia pseudomallei TSV32]